MSSVSTFGAFTTARLGIYASQKALEVVGNNIANINTPGYTRQALNQQSLYMGGSDRYSTSLDARVGSGALVTGVSQLRDPYLDIRYRNEQSSVGAMDAKLSGLEQLAGVFDEVGKGTDGEGFMEAQFNDLIEQIQNLVTQGAGKKDYDSLVRGSASSLVTLFRTYGEKLETLMNNQRKGFEQDLQTVNTILEDIRDLNGAIRKSQIHGSDALELKDQRNSLIDQLSQYVRVDVTYEKEDIGAGVEVEKLVIKLGGDNPATLIDGVYGTQMSIPEHLPPADPDNPPDPPVDNKSLLIQLGALTDKNGKVLDGSEAVQLGDNDLYGALQAQRELLTEEGEFASADDIALDPNAVSKRGIPYYQKSLDVLANKFAEVLNEANKKMFVGYETEKGADGLEHFKIKKPECKLDDPPYGTNATLVPAELKKMVEAGTLQQADMDAIIALQNTHLSPDGLGHGFPITEGGALFSNGGDGNDTTNITASNISIAKDWADGKVHIRTSSEVTDVTQSTNNSNLVHILYLMTADHDYTPGDLPGGDSASAATPLHTGSFQGMMTKMGSTLANDTKTATAALRNYSATADELYVSRDAVSGVDLNDEAMGMMQYQKSYSAACRLMTTIDEMIDKLINGTGRAGL